MKFRTLIKLMDIKTLVAGVIPVTLGSAYSSFAFGKMNWLFMGLLLVAMVLIQSATNMINDYFDFKKGSDDEGKGDEKALVTGEARKNQVIGLILIFKLIAISIGLFIASQTSYNILFVALAGVIISVLYAFGRIPISHLPIGEIVAGSTMGIGITTTVIYIQSGIFNMNTILVAIPTAIFIATILLSNNLSDMEPDKKAGRKTLPILIGRKNAEKLWIGSVVFLFILSIGLGVFQIYPLSVLILVLLIFPYKDIKHFLSYEKNVQTKGKTMGLIGKIGVKFHVALILGLIIALYI